MSAQTPLSSTALIPGPQHLSAEGLAFIAGWETFSDVIYLDQGGRATIGYGHLIKPNETFPHPITPDAGLHLLHEDVRTTEIGVSGLCMKANLLQRELDSAIIFAFNVGIGAAMHSHFFQLLLAGRKQQAADELLRWVHVRDKKTGALKFSQGLKNRRTNERALFLGLPYEAHS